MKRTVTRGYTLVELMVAIGLFAIIMVLSSGAYLLMIGINQQAQGIATGVDNLSFALETMTRTIRTGSEYTLNSPSSFTVTDASDRGQITYTLVDGSITQNDINLTDESVNITTLNFDVSGTAAGDYVQPRVIITVSGTVSGKTPKSFTIETGATMRGTDIPL